MADIEFNNFINPTKQLVKSSYRQHTHTHTRVT